MTDDKLCFVLGAGASSHFGYPLGNELVEAMETFIKLLPKEYELKSDLKAQMAHVKDYNPLSIDYYLYNYPDAFKGYSENFIKRLLEAVILHSQTYGALSYSENRRKWWRAKRKEAFGELEESEKKSNGFPAWNWVKFIHHRIVANCKDYKGVINELDNIFIITFNYDLSFENALFKYFDDTIFARESEGKLNKYLKEEFFEKQVIHVYGKVKGDYECNFNLKYSKDNASDNFDASDGNGINVIGVHKSLLDGNCKDKKCNQCQKIIDCQNKIKESDKIYFLGYAFDDFNNKALDLENNIKKNDNYQEIYYTNLGDGFICDSTVRTFTGKDYKPFPVDNRVTHAIDATGSKKLKQIIKSTKNVYQALESDLNIPLSKKPEKPSDQELAA